MNYIIENNVNFFSELRNELQSDLSNNLIGEIKSLNENIDKDICLITHQPLQTNYITLACQHRFNYLPLYNEVSNQKQPNYLEITHLLINQIKCPYCRRITNKLLPYIEHKDITYKKGVNYPIKYCMKIHSCQWIMKSGKNHGKLCNKPAYHTELGTYCNLHQTLSKEKQIQKEKELAIEILWSANHEQLLKNYNVIQLKHLLRENNKKIGGNKKQLVHRIITYNLINHISISV
jgi:hypothetical protein